MFMFTASPLRNLRNVAFLCPCYYLTLYLNEHFFNNVTKVNFKLQVLRCYFLFYSSHILNPEWPFDSVDYLLRCSLLIWTLYTNYLFVI